uniref:Uncharacterized protein n=1 Tax=Ditylenchus dipsaci TaxID=166011 RepID=A0A915DQI4_9BILA
MGCSQSIRIRNTDRVFAHNGPYPYCSLCITYNQYTKMSDEIINGDVLAPSMSVEQLKEAGNDAFKNGDYQKSMDYYSKALKLETTKDFEGAESDCTSALEIEPHNAKAFYRRALAREQLDKVGAAFRDAKEALRLQPSDRSLTELCEKLMKMNSDRLKKVESTENKVAEMLRLTFDSQDSEKVFQAMNNLLVLCRDSEDGAVKVWQDGKVVSEFLGVLNDKAKWSDELATSAMRILDELAKKEKGP